MLPYYLRACPVGDKAPSKAEDERSCLDEVMKHRTAFKNA